MEHMNIFDVFKILIDGGYLTKRLWGPLDAAYLVHLKNYDVVGRISQDDFEALHKRDMLVIEIENRNAKGGINYVMYALRLPSKMGE